MTAIAVSPYHLTTREPPAMAALLLGARVFTVMPGVMGAAGSRDSVRSTAKHSARYAALLDSWSWSMPLWRAGVIDSAHAGDDAAADLEAVWDKIAADDRYISLRPFMHLRLESDRRQLIEAVAADVLKGGPNPAVCVPLAAGLDRFAARHRLVVARAAPTSVAQRAEALLGEPLVTTVVPLLQQATAEQMLDARRLLATPLTAWRAALAREDGPTRSQIGDAAAALERAFPACLAQLTATADPSDPPIMWGPVSIAIATLPPDAVLTSSVTAAESFLRKSPSPAATSGSVATTTLPALADPADFTRVTTMIIKPLGRPVVAS